MFRRRALASLIAAQALWPAALRAQPGEPARIGLLSFGSAPGAAPIPTRGRASSRGCSSPAARPGRNLVIEARYADGEPQRLAALAGELARLNPAAIVAGGPASVHAARTATSTVPIVAIGVVDPGRPGLGAKPGAPGRQPDRP